MRPFSHRIERFISARVAISVKGKKTLLNWDNRELSGGEKDRGEKKEGGRYPRQKSRAARSMRWRGEVGRMRCQNHSIAKKRGKDREGPQKFPVFLPTGKFSASLINILRQTAKFVLVGWSSLDLGLLSIGKQPTSVFVPCASGRCTLALIPCGGQFRTRQLNNFSSLVSRASKVNYAFRRNARH